MTMEVGLHKPHSIHVATNRCNTLFVWNVDSNTFLIICEALYKVKFGNLRLFWMHVTSHFKVMSSVPPQVLGNFVQQYGIQN